MRIPYPHVIAAAIISAFLSFGWWHLLPSLPQPVKGFAALGGVGGLLVGVFYRQLLLAHQRSSGVFYDIAEGSMFAPLRNGETKSERFRFLFPRATLLLTVCFSGLGVGGVSMLDVWPIMAKNIGL